MLKRTSCILCVVVVVSWAGIASLWAGPNDDAKARLNSVRQEIGALKRNYEGDIQKIKSEANANIDVIKKEFHAKRDKYVNESNGRQKEVTNAYKSKIKPLLAEEKQLIEVVHPGSMNFAKPKDDTRK